MRESVQKIKREYRALKRSWGFPVLCLRLEGEECVLMREDVTLMIDRRRKKENNAGEM